METRPSRRPEIGTRDTLGNAISVAPDYHNDLPTPPFRLPKFHGLLSKEVLAPSCDMPRNRMFQSAHQRRRQDQGRTTAMIAVPFPRSRTSVAGQR
jgi:hypothetical protein